MNVISQLIVCTRPSLSKYPQMIENLFSYLPMRTAPLGDLCQPQAGSQTPNTASFYLSRTYMHGDVSGWLLPWVPGAVFVPPRFPPPLQSCSSPCPLSLEIAIQLSAWLESFASWQGRKGGGGRPRPRGSERWMDSRRMNRTSLDLERNIRWGRACTLPPPPPLSVELVR